MKVDKNIEAIFNEDVSEKRKANFHFKPKPIRFGIENKTNKELSKMNSDVKTYKFTQIFAKEYKTLPPDIQKAQLEFIYNRYKGKITYIAAFYGVTRQTVRNMLSTYKIRDNSNLPQSHAPALATERQVLLSTLRKDIGEGRFAEFMKSRNHTNERVCSKGTLEAQKTESVASQTVDDVVDDNSNLSSDILSNEEPKVTEVTEVSNVPEEFSPADEGKVSEIISENSMAAREDSEQEIKLQLSISGEADGKILSRKLKTIAKLVETGCYEFNLKIALKERENNE